ncbi:MULTISPECIES: hypothetical protein [Cyanophyceae]|nr:hypothetical protein [Trichocoleus sp. FACHB-69]MBD1931996.1 hypothetical protein [Trichocoleus sp. FACHB-69]
MVLDSGGMRKERSLQPYIATDGIYQNRPIELVELPQDAIACMIAVRG